jgi:hypothetical protein
MPRLPAWFFGRSTTVPLWDVKGGWPTRSSSPGSSIVVGVVRRFGRVIGAGVRRIRGVVLRLVGVVVALVGRARNVIAAGVRLAGRPIRAAGRVVRRALRRVVTGARAMASLVPAAFKPLAHIARRFRLVSTNLVKTTRASARQLNAQTRRSLRSAVRRSSHRSPIAPDSGRMLSLLGLAVKRGRGTKGVRRISSSPDHTVSGAIHWRSRSLCFHAYSRRIWIVNDCFNRVTVTAWARILRSGRMR